MQLRFNYNGNGATPGLGGFILGFNARANAVFIQKFMAKLPIGYSFNNAENYMGDHASVSWLTPRSERKMGNLCKSCYMWYRNQFWKWRSCIC